jgi:hypothetical protein
MKTFHFFVKISIPALLMMLNVMIADAQAIWINGRVFEKTSVEKAEAIPFATVYYCDIDNADKIEYVGFTDLGGNYDIGKNVAVKSYHVKIEAPGYVAREKRVGNLPKDVKGNLTLHFEMKPEGNAAYNVKTYEPSELSSGKKPNVLEVIAKVPEVYKDDAGNLMTLKGGSVKLLLNGAGMNIPDMSKLEKLPYQAVKGIEYYDLGDDHPMYQGVLNLVLNAGDQAALNFVPFETNQFNL